MDGVDGLADRGWLACHTCRVRPSVSKVASERRPLRSTTAVGVPQEGSMVVVVVPSGVVVAVDVTGPPLGGVYAVVVWLPRTSVVSVGRPYGSRTVVDLVSHTDPPERVHALATSTRVGSP